ncbi:hypothetical protein JB92DRAFT_1821451 [Gautieria morchelliformis]|nr:hypothetical protein JB92DRAFT_1821451 [Gautieria morchelliformis]
MNYGPGVVYPHGGEAVSAPQTHVGPAATSGMDYGPGVGYPHGGEAVPAPTPCAPQQAHSYPVSHHSHPPIYMSSQPTSRSQPRSLSSVVSQTPKTMCLLIIKDIALRRHS